MAKDLMYQDEIKEVVRDAYSAIDRGGGESVARRVYSDEELSGLPPGPSSGP